MDAGCFNADDPSDGLPPGWSTRFNNSPTDFQRMEDESAYASDGKTRAQLTDELRDRSAADQAQADEEAAAPVDPRTAQLDLASLRLRATIEFILAGCDQSTDPEMRLKADIIRIVIGEGSPPRMTVLAKRHGFSRAAVSLRCRTLLRQLAIEPSRFMRPEDEVRNMRISAIFRGFSAKTTPPGKESIENPPVSRNARRLRSVETKGLKNLKGKANLRRKTS